MRENERRARASMQQLPPSDAAPLPGSAAAPAPALLGRSRSVREQQAQLKHKLRELPALLRSGLTLSRRRSCSSSSGGSSSNGACPCPAASAGPTLSERVSNSYLDHPSVKVYGKNASCAGRALRNVFRTQASDLIKDRMYLTGVCRRSCIGSDLVDWLLQYCPFLHRRSTATGVWQILLQLGILSSVDKQLCFQDTYAFYQFSSEECTEMSCEFGNDKEWQKGVRLLQELVPFIPPRPLVCSLSTEKLQDTSENNELLQIQALARLTSVVQRELAAVIALKARKSVINQEEENCKEVAACDTPTDISEKEAGVMCKLQETDDIGRLELVQKLARDNRRFLLADKKESKKTEQIIRQMIPAYRGGYRKGTIVSRRRSHLAMLPPRSDKDEETTTVQVREQEQDVLVLKKVSSESPAPIAGSATNDWRYMVVSGTPEKILEHLLNDLHLDEVQDKGTDTLLDDFLLTYTVFMTTDDLCQALLRHYCAKKDEVKGEASASLRRKRKVLHLASQWAALYKDWLHEDEHSKLFLKTLYRYVLDDMYEHPILEKELKEFQKALRMHRRHTVDEYSPHRKNKALFHQFSLKENWLQHRGTVNEVEEMFCRVYITDHSYVSIRTKVSASAQEIQRIVAEKIQHAEEDLALATVAFSGEKRELLPNDVALSKPLEGSSRIFIYRKDLSDTLNPLAENEESQHRPVRVLGMNTWDLALELTNFDWSLFNSIHEQELIYFTFSRQGSGHNTANLSLLLQRCNEVQLWIATEILLCSQLGKRVQLVKKFIKIAAHCKAQRNLNSFFAIIMGLNTASVSRLSQTWEKIPGKFKKLFSELESLTDPSLNHKAYRDAFKKMKPPKIPFMPLLLKDVTFIHEGNKTFLDNLVNFEKLHMIADTVRSLRYCRNNQFGSEVPQKEHQEVKSYVHHLHVIDSQQTLFELSHRIEPRA
ncbi:rap guanine nucleotide exchange factor 5 isoform X2 [Rhinatrema bivittatum]|uniref:rap guanine nucleotide exchange factor 5 isoform X2 n=1 Tax=Rhinatrema bivittatum TaxID=194408 RepID=UPI00112A41CF|nr:rap guanine nucleotide exchange factor 5 isoform X2 [Rhinatrema bivittatum]